MKSNPDVEQMSALIMSALAIPDYVEPVSNWSVEKFWFQPLIRMGYLKYGPWVDYL